MSKNEMCPYSDGGGYTLDTVWHRPTPEVEAFFEKPNKRVKCPECGRKMWAMKRTCHDGCCQLYLVPPHKVKGWWKKGRTKKTSRDVVGRRV